MNMLISVQIVLQWVTRKATQLIFPTHSSPMVILFILTCKVRILTTSSGAFTVGKIADEERFDVVRHGCPGPGACGGMYTANTMSSALEVHPFCFAS